MKADQEQASRASDRFDPGVAHPARVYNYWLGGKDHYLADRVVADEVARRRPHVVAGARANRAFLARAVDADLYAGIARISPHACASATRLGVLVG